MKKVLALVLSLSMVLCLFAACGKANTDDSTGTDASATPVASGVEDGVLTVAMECAYAPYNWTQQDDANGAVPIKDTNEFANGYDIMIAKQICEKNGWER